MAGKRTRKLNLYLLLLIIDLEAWEEIVGWVGWVGGGDRWVGVNRESDYIMKRY